MSRLAWIQAGPYDLAELAAKAVVRSLEIGDSHLTASDMVFLVDRKSVGLDIARRLEALGIEVQHEFDEARGRRGGLVVAAPRVKGATIHSFKGWEARALVVALRRGSTRRDLRVAYSAITRLKAHPYGSYLTVISSAPELESYGREWPLFSRAS